VRWPGICKMLRGSEWRFAWPSRWEDEAPTQDSEIVAASVRYG